MAERSGLPTDEAAAEPAAEEPQAVRPEAPAEQAVVTRSARSLVWQARIGAGLGVLGLAVAIAMFVFTAEARTAEATRDAVLEAAEVVALRVTTFDGATIDDWVADTQALATGEYADEVAQLFDTEIRQGLAEAQVQSVGEITSSFVQEVRDDEATAFLVMRQSYTNVNQQTPVSDELRMEVELVRQDGEWLASEVVVLGPSTISPVGTPGEGAGASEPAPTSSEEER